MMIAYYSKCQVFAKANKMTINVQGYEMSYRCMLAIVKKKKKMPGDVFLGDHFGETAMFLANSVSGSVSSLSSLQN